ncbi:MAG: hypothetical protein Q8P70_01330 [bacterium]|nr:hypothetical protein [bacterium]
MLTLWDILLGGVGPEEVDPIGNPELFQVAMEEDRARRRLLQQEGRESHQGNTCQGLSDNLDSIDPCRAKAREGTGTVRPHR